MEERNMKGQNTLYAVIGVATLIVAIIGATFAFFSAQATASDDSDDIEGGTNNTLATALSLKVERVTFEEATEPDAGEGEEGTETTANYNNLVPAIIDVTTAGIKKAVDEKCVNAGYTGCHLYKITASSSQTLQTASIRLAKLTTTATDKASWKYVIYNSASGAANDVTSIKSDANNTNRDFATFATEYPYVEGEVSGYDMHAAGLTEGTPVYYYLLVYLANKDNTVQNPELTTDANSGTGTYEGIVTMDAAGGKVVASFSTSTSGN